MSARPETPEEKIRRLRALREAKEAEDAVLRRQRNAVRRVRHDARREAARRIVFDMVERALRGDTADLDALLGIPRKGEKS